MAIRDQACVDFDHVTARFRRPAVGDKALEREAARIDMSRAAPWPLKPDKGGTVWMGAIDADGLAVSFIQSVFWDYGSGCVLPATGVLMQNRGAAFSLDANARNPLTPGRRPFHTLNPALAVFDDGRVLAYGSKGADGQPQFQAQVFTRIAAGAPLDEALAAPRHFFTRTRGEPTATVKLEEGYDDSTATALAAAGHGIEWKRAAERDLFGHAGALMRSQRGDVAAAHDPRSDGGPAGL